MATSSATVRVQESLTGDGRNVAPFCIHFAYSGNFNTLACLSGVRFSPSTIGSFLLLIPASASLEETSLWGWRLPFLRLLSLTQNGAVLKIQGSLVRVISLVLIR